MSASATSTNTGLDVEASHPSTSPSPRPALQDRQEGAFGQRVVQAKHVLGTVLNSGVSSIY
jgi:hypothetical protein